MVLQALTIPMNFLREFEDEKWERKFLSRAEVKTRRLSLLKPTAPQPVNLKASATQAVNLKSSSTQVVKK